VSVSQVPFPGDVEITHARDWSEFREAVLQHAICVAFAATRSTAYYGSGWSGWMAARTQASAGTPC
jgi:hypothetical protein